MVYWLPYPMVRFALIWVVGLVCGFSYSVNIQQAYLGLSILGLLWLLVRLLRSGSLVEWVILLTITFSLGFTNAQGVWRSPAEKLWTADAYWGKVEDVVIRDSSKSIITLKLLGFIDKHQTRAVNRNFKVQAYGYGPALQAGMTLMVKGAPKEINAPLNPGVFNYKRYLLGQGVVARDWWRAERLVLIDTAALWQFSFRNLRQTMIQRLESQLPDAPGRQVLQAMVLGYREQVDPKVRETFAAAGTVHLLVVSGLHLGILYALGLKLTQTIRRTTWGKWLVTLIILVVIWSYTLLTGMGIATIRAAIMFTILSLGKLSHRSGSSFNSLALAGLIILTAQPQALFSIGFQLSFSALLGIFMIQPRLHRYFRPGNKLMRYLWELITVSISAQLAVAPLLMFYFQQVSWYFLLGNLLTVPLGTLVLILGMCYFVFAWVDIPIFLKTLHFLADQCYRLNHWVSSLPGSHSDQVWISLFELWIFYAVLIVVIGWLRAPKTFSRWAFRILIILGLTWSGYRVKLGREHRLLIYHLPQATAMDYRNGFHTQRIQHEVTPDHQRYVMGPVFGRLGARSSLRITKKYPNRPQLWSFDGKLVLLVDEVSIKAALYQKCHYLIITDTQVERIVELLPRLKAEKIILDGSNRARNWQTWLVNISHFGPWKHRVHITALQGAFLNDINSRRATNIKY